MTERTALVYRREQMGMTRVKGGTTIERNEVVAIPKGGAPDLFVESLRLSLRSHA